MEIDTSRLEGLAGLAAWEHAGDNHINPQSAEAEATQMVEQFAEHPPWRPDPGTRNAIAATVREKLGDVLSGSSTITIPETAPSLDGQGRTNGGSPSKLPVKDIAKLFISVFTTLGYSDVQTTADGLGGIRVAAYKSNSTP